MGRKIEKKLLSWKNDQRKMPLLLNGARQVGKTYTALMFGKKYYKNTAYFNLEDSRELCAIFERDLDPDRLTKELSVISGQSIFKHDTLIIFDEIQACERALTSLKYFCEQAPEYHIIAAGSLLGVALNRENYSFPVGKVELLTMYPCDLEEFLWALGKKELSELVREAYDSQAPFTLHDTLLDLYKLYLTIGGMPQVINTYIEQNDFNFVRAIQKSLNDSYIADMAKYATPHETTRIMATWNSIPGQLAKENHKFQYKFIKSGARAHDYELPIEWLRSAGMINKCVQVSEGKIPLSAYASADLFKLYMVDTGLLCSKFDIAPQVILNGAINFDGFKGALAENYVMQSLIVNDFSPFYWASPGKAEVDFVLQDRSGQIIPVEVKSSDNVRAKSLKLFMEKYDVPYAVRVSAKNFGYENGIKSIPLYALFCWRK